LAFPKWESLKNKSGKSGKFSSAKNDRQVTSVSPAIHHKFTIKKPRSAPRFCQNPQQKRRLSSAGKTTAKVFRGGDPDAVIPVFLPE
jgi:hypothetical protein